MHKKSKEMELCIQQCLDCYRICLETKSYCLEQGGEHVEPSHIKALSDCIELCKISAHFMIKGSELSADVCQVCAEACQTCADSCSKIADDETMSACADQCRSCAQSCENMASSA